MRRDGLHDLTEGEGQAMAAAQAEFAASQRLDAALQELLQSTRSAENSAGSPMATEAFKRAANAGLRHAHALESYAQAIRARAEMQAAQTQRPAQVTQAAHQQLAEFDGHVLRWRGSAPRGQRDQILKAALALASEAGEVAGAVEKWAYRGEALDTKKLLDELGDVLYNLADLAIALGHNLGDVALANVAKWGWRYPGGPATKEGPRPSPWRTFWLRWLGG